MRTKEATSTTPAQAIRSYMETRAIRYRLLVTSLGIRKDTLSRMLSDTGRYRNERLSPEIISRIAATLDVPRAVEAEWLGLLSPNTTN